MIELLVGWSAARQTFLTHHADLLSVTHWTNRMMLRAVLTFALWLSIQASALAETRALLIGVSDYDETLGLSDLRGPANDVRLMRKTLNGLGVKDITILADNIDGAHRPTRAAIERAFEELATTAAKGDLVIIQFSGHGTRQRDTNGDEPDGVDEVFLPSNTLPAKAGVGLVRNAIIDDEFGAWTSRIRQSGADVWLIIDTCHAGTGLRNPSQLLAQRYVAPETLGASATPQAAAGAAQRRIIESQSERSGTGGIIAFYAARANEIARELNFGALGTNKKATGPWYGLFTARLARRLQSLNGQTYRQLFQAVLADLNAMPLPNVARMQTPSWEGTMPDRVVLGHVHGRRGKQFAVVSNEIDAGSVHGLTVGSIVDLFADAAAPDSDVLGRAQLIEVGARRSRFRPVDSACKTALADQLCAAVPAHHGTVRFVRVRNLAPNTEVRLSALRVLPNGGKATVAARADLETRLKETVSRLNYERQTNFVIGAASADVQVGLRDGELWFGGTVDIEGRPAGLRWHPDAGDLSPLLVRIYKAERLAKQLQAVSRETSILDPNPVEVEAQSQFSNPALLHQARAQLDPIAECQAVMRAPNGYSPSRRLAQQAHLKQCDRLHFVARGVLPGARDVNRVYIDAKYCVTNSYRRVEDDRRAIPIGEDMVSCSDCPNGYVAGKERVFVLVSEVVANRAPLNLTGMFDDCSASGSTRSGNSATASLRHFLRSNRLTRSLLPAAHLPTVWVNAFSWLVMPRSVALGRLPIRKPAPQSLSRN